jgi:hypothetical protein
MRDHVPWSWSESLGGLRPDPSQAFRVERIRCGMVKDRCSEIGLREGQEVRCRGRTREDVSVELSDGRVSALELPFAWFVQVRPVSEPASALQS